MNPENKIIAENIIIRLQKSQNGLLSKSVLLKEFSTNINKLNPILLTLSDDFALVKLTETNEVRLTDKGFKFKTFDQLEKDSKKESIPRYQKIYLPFFIIFGLFGVYKIIFPSISKSDYENLKSQSQVWKSQADSLMTESRIYKDSVGLLNRQIELYKTQSIIDTSQTKN